VCHGSEGVQERRLGDPRFAAFCRKVGLPCAEGGTSNVITRFYTIAPETQSSSWRTSGVPEYGGANSTLAQSARALAAKISHLRINAQTERGDCNDRYCHRDLSPRPLALATHGARFRREIGVVLRLPRPAFRQLP
jgi:hypothetical protein